MNIHKNTRYIVLTLFTGWACGAFAQGDAHGEDRDVLNVIGKVTNMSERPLDSVIVTVDQEGKVIQELLADGRGRFTVSLAIGGFYGIKLARPGYIPKRFIIDSRTDDPSKVITGDFQPEVSLRPQADLADVDISELDMPYAYIQYSKKDKAFIADAEYIAEMKKVEAALMLSAARAKKRTTP